MDTQVITQDEYNNSLKEEGIKICDSAISTILLTLDYIQGGLKPDKELLTQTAIELNNLKISLDAI